jgi:Tfp pilus assembly protein PilN
MITINLLPDEFRKTRRSSFKAIAAVAAFVAIDTTLVAWWAWTAFGVQAEVQVLLNVAQSDLDTQKPQVEYYRALERESREFASREATLETITAQRISWTEKVDQLVDVVHRGGDGDKYLVWLDDLNVVQKVDTKAGTLGTLRADAHSGGPHIAHMANFLDDLAGSDFARGFLPPKAPQGRLTDREVEFIPAENWAFPLEFQIKAPPAKKPAPKAKASSSKAKKS